MSSFLVGFCQGCILLVMPVVIAAAVGVVEAFILSFGMKAVLKLSVQSGSQFMSRLFYDLPMYSFYLLLVPCIIAVISMVPAKKCLFDEAPPLRRSIKKTPTVHNPVATFFLFFIPFYFIYWWAAAKTECNT